MRKSFDGLCSLVEHGFRRDPYDGDVFAFFNRRCNYVKLLVWDNNGFWLCAKRLEGGTFEQWCPESGDDSHVEIDRARLMMLLEGIDMKKAKYRRHFNRSIRMAGHRDGKRTDGEDGRRRQA